MRAFGEVIAITDSTWGNTILLVDFGIGRQEVATRSYRCLYLGRGPVGVKPADAGLLFGPVKGVSLNVSK
jgi:hypothetical protein